MKTKEFSMQLRIASEMHAKLKVVAAEELRSLNSQIEYFVLHGIKAYEREHGIIKPEEDAVLL